MKKVINTIRHVRKELNIALLISLVLLFCIEFWWKHLPPVWEDAYEGAELMKDFLLAYIASYVFFFISDHWQRLERSEVMAKAIDRRMIDVITAFQQMLLYVNSNARMLGLKPRLGQATEEEWKELFEGFFWYQGYPNEAPHLLETIYQSWHSLARNAMGPIDQVLERFSDYDIELTARLDDLRHHLSRIEAMRALWTSKNTPERHIAEARTGMSIPTFLVWDYQRMMATMESFTRLLDHLQHRQGAAKAVDRVRLQMAATA